MKNVIDYVTNIYNKEALDNGYVYIEALSKSEAFLIAAYWAEQRKENEKEYKKHLRFAATFYSEMKKGGWL